MNTINIVIIRIDWLGYKFSCDNFRISSIFVSLNQLSYTMIVTVRSLRRRRTDILDVGESTLDVGETTVIRVNGSLRCRLSCK